MGVREVGAPLPMRTPDSHAGPTHALQDVYMQACQLQTDMIQTVCISTHREGTRRNAVDDNSAFLQDRFTDLYHS